MKLGVDVPAAQLLHLRLEGLFSALLGGEASDLVCPAAAVHSQAKG